MKAISSTEGSTLVRAASVTRVDALAENKLGLPFRVTLRFEDGKVRSYEVTAGSGLGAGEFLTVTSPGVTTITRSSADAIQVN